MDIEFEDEPYEPDPTLRAFKIKQGYATDYPYPFKCKSCGGSQFEVTRHEYFSAIRCPKCLWEKCIHNG